MAIAPFLAMTAAEMYQDSSLPSKVAWMACHFSPYGLGLSNLPRELPPGTLLMVDDITPPHGHDPVRIAEQLCRCVETLQCCAVLLDFQRKDCAETRLIAKHLAQTLPCPTVVSECYARNLNCPVFLSPLPPSMPLQDYLDSWKDREIWLELVPEGEVLSLTESGCSVQSFPYPNLHAEGFPEEILHCHYTVETTKTSAGFTLWRTEEDLMDLLQEAEMLGVSGAVGLFQEWNHCKWIK